MHLDKTGSLRYEDSIVDLSSSHVNTTTHMMPNADRTNSETVKTEIYQPPVSVLKVWFQKPDVTVLLRPVFF